MDEHLKVEGFNNVFAVGDATNVKETKLGYLAAAQVPLQPPSASHHSGCAASGVSAQPRILCTAHPVDRLFVIYRLGSRPGI